MVPCSREVQVDPPYRVSFGDETFVDVDYDPMKMFPGGTPE